MWTEKTLYDVIPLKRAEGDSGLIPCFAINKLYDFQVLSSDLYTQLFNSTCLVILLIGFQFNYTVVREYVLYDFSPLTAIETYSMTQHMSIFMNVLCVLLKSVHSIAG